MKSDKDKIMAAFKDVASYGSKIDDWVHIKKEVMKLLPSHLRKYFSRRDSKTKNHIVNNFEQEMINYYESICGIRLIVRSLNERRKIFGKLSR